MENDSQPLQDVAAIISSIPDGAPNASLVAAIILSVPSTADQFMTLLFGPNIARLTPHMADKLMHANQSAHIVDTNNLLRKPSHRLGSPLAAAELPTSIQEKLAFVHQVRFVRWLSHTASTEIYVELTDGGGTVLYLNDAFFPTYVFVDV